MDREDLLKTREQRFSEKKWDRMFVSRSMITSEAFLSLKTAAAHKVLMIFLNKCQWKPVEAKPKRKAGYYLANNGEIQFTYIEAREKWGISDGRFLRAIDELVQKGFIDIAKSGLGLHKDVTLYAISDRWEKYGADDFVHIERPKRVEQLGFRKGNRHGRNCR
ncbi:MAG: hypothetical protein JSU94_16730 [Phycisphaerales bacterium]|nr:MAG: hypothetical protein JSU94_16730 [Phycisphaerales bacterium]